MTWGDLKREKPLLDEKLKHWAKTYGQNKASTFTKQEIETLLQLDQSNDPLLLQDLVFTILSICGALRHCEAIAITFGDIEKIYSAEGQVLFEVVVFVFRNK